MAEFHTVRTDQAYIFLILDSLDADIRSYA